MKKTNKVEFLERQFHSKKLSFVHKKESEHSFELSLSTCVFYQRILNLEMQKFSLENHHMMNARQPFSWRMTSTLPSPGTTFSQSLSVNLFRWRIRGERAGNALTFSHGPRGPQRFGRAEKWGLGTRQTPTKLQIRRLLPHPLCGCPFDFCGGGGMSDLVWARIFFPNLWS